MSSQPVVDGGVGLLCRVESPRKVERKFASMPPQNSSQQPSQAKTSLDVFPIKLITFNDGPVLQQRIIIF